MTNLRVRRVAKVPVVVTIIGTCRKMEKGNELQAGRKWNHNPPAQDLVTEMWSSGFWPMGTISSQILSASFLLMRDEKGVRMRTRRENHHNFVRGQNTFTDNNQGQR